MQNDGWPNPAADFVTGPHFKVRCRNEKSCGQNGDPDMTYDNTCYDTLAFVDRYGSYHHAMPDNAVAPQEYSDVYIPYGRYNNAVMALMVRNNQLRAVLTSVLRNQHRLKKKLTISSTGLHPGFLRQGRRGL